MIPPAFPTGFERKLAEFDSRLRVRWDHEKNLWLVEERGRRTGLWRYVFYWALKDARGNYAYFKPLPQTPGPILDELHRIDYERLGVLNQRDWQKVARNMESGRRTYLDNRRAEKADELRQAAFSKFPYYMRGRRAVALDQTQVPSR